jgi:putative hemolysin
MLTDLAVLLGLIVINGIFAMSEIAVVSSKKARLQQLAAKGHAGAVRALALGAEPTRFLSTVQFGITSIGILSGAVGEATIASKLRAAFETVPLLADHADGLSLAIMVIGLTYVSLIVGELVPKRLGLLKPERVASIVARPMQLLATIGRPLIYVLSLSTDSVLRLFRVKTTREPGISLDEIKILMAQGTSEGVFEKVEQDMVANVLDLDDRHAGAILTPRSDIVFLDLEHSAEEQRQELAANPHGVLPVCRGGLDQVVGFVRSTDVLARLVRGEPLDLAAMVSPALFVPRTVTLMKLLQQFRQAHFPLALVVNEHGDVDGLVSLTDVLAAIVGELPETSDDEPAVVRRQDGSFLLDGGLPLDHAQRALGAGDLDLGPERFQTLAGFVMHRLGRVPRTGDSFAYAGFHFEVVDMDGNRIDRVLVSRTDREAVRPKQPPMA